MTGRTACLGENIPSAFVNKTLLGRILDELSSELSSTEYTLAIPTKLKSWYYQFHLSYCEELDQYIDLLIAFPL